MSEWTDRIDRLRLVRTEGVGPVTYRRLLDRYHSPAAALDALPAARPRGRTIRGGAGDFRGGGGAGVGSAPTHAAGGSIFLGDPDYPPLLAMMDDAPPCLIVRGEAALAQRRCVAAVGGRNASANGQRMAETLAAELAATARRGLRPGARHRHRRACRGDAHRPHHRGDRRRDRPALPAGKCRPAPPHRATPTC